MNAPRVGVLALQGAFAAHVERLRSLGAAVGEVRTPEQLRAVDALVMPGGESTTMSNLLDSTGLYDPIAIRLEEGMPVFGTCAGMILLADKILDGRDDQQHFGQLDITVRRNGYGRQVDSFETDLVVAGHSAPFHGVFIRAPRWRPPGLTSKSWPRTMVTRCSCVKVICWLPASILNSPTTHDYMLSSWISSRSTDPMSGHSKWATIKHKKGAADKARGKLFAKLARQLEVAAKAGGGDPDANPTLRTAVQKAKAAQMTNDAIDRAIKRGTGEGDGGTYESIMYEGYVPGGVALLIDVLTDNRNRTGSEVRGVFNKLGGSLAEPGAVSWQFSRRGIIEVDGSAGEDELMLAALDAGAADVERDGETWTVTTDPSLVYEIRQSLEDAGFTIDSADTPLVSDNLVPIAAADEARRVLRIVEALEDNDDVQDVFSNADIPEALLSELVEA